MVSEIIMLKQILGFKKRALYILPYVSIVMEKEQYLSKLCQNINLKITQLHSLSNEQWTPSTDLGICTIEKANALVNKVIEEKLYFDIELFIIDEMHLLLDESRGFLLECLISKLKTIQALISQKNRPPKQFQIIGMSATMSGQQIIQTWLDTQIYQCQFRPVPLSEYAILNGQV